MKHLLLPLAAAIVISALTTCAPPAKSAPVVEGAEFAVSDRVVVHHPRIVVRHPRFWRHRWHRLHPWHRPPFPRPRPPLRFGGY